jgi:hypothetical protein
MTQTMMKCGCAAQGHRVMKDDSRIPACLIHDCVEPAASAPDLTDRKARCAYYGKSTAKRGSYGGGNECNYGQSESPTCTCEQPSSPKLPFFEYCGDGSTEAKKCKCGYYESAHKPDSSIRCRKFEPHGGHEFDKFYCGCHGWD